MAQATQGALSPPAEAAARHLPAGAGQRGAAHSLPAAMFPLRRERERTREGGVWGRLWRAAGGRAAGARQRRRLPRLRQGRAAGGGGGRGRGARPRPLASCREAACVSAFGPARRGAGEAGRRGEGAAERSGPPAPAASRLPPARSWSAP